MTNILRTSLGRTIDEAEEVEVDMGGNSASRAISSSRPRIEDVTLRLMGREMRSQRLSIGRSPLSSTSVEKVVSKKGSLVLDNDLPLDGCE